MKNALFAAFVLPAALLSGGCRSGDVSSAGAAPAANTPAANTPAASAAAPAPGAGGAAAEAARSKRARPIAPIAPEPWHVPVGVALPILPGEGVGPIRFGANLETIERLMEQPCEEKRQDAPNVLACRYSAHAVEFFLKDGGLERLRIHRLGRPFFKDPTPDFGIYNGRFQSGASLGMLQPAVQELLGKPKAVRPVKEPGLFNTVEQHEYDGFVLEYDKSQTSGQIVLGGIQLSAPKGSKAKKAAQAR